MITFNLISDPWIPVRYLAGGQNALVSLSTLFREAAEIGDLSCPAHERISIMRLLVCITQTALGAPETSDDWPDFGSEMETQIPLYLEDEGIAVHFNLFGEGPRFLQDCTIARERKFQEHSSWIVFHLASGNNYTLFDHEGGTQRSLPADILGRALITFQNFSPPVGKHTAYGFCSENSCLHTLLLAKNIKRSILLNCIDHETIKKSFQGGIGRPVWEEGSASDPLALSSYLYRLVPVHRKLWFKDASTLYKSYDGISYPLFKSSGIRESSQTVVAGEKGRFLLRCSAARSVWRDLHALTIERLADGTGIGPLTIQSHFDELLEYPVFPIFAGGLVFENTASLTSVVESSLSIPSMMLHQAGRNCFLAGANFAEISEQCLLNALKKYSEAQKVQKTMPKQRAASFFWNSLEYNIALLLGIVRDTAIMDGKSFGEGDDPWTLAVRTAARQAYDHVCSRATPRQLQAYAAGLKVLLPKAKKPQPSKEPVSL